MTKIETKLIGLTQPVEDIEPNTPENLISYCARVSNPSNQGNFDTEEKLLAYCIRNKHWSIFQIVNAVMEIKGPRDITRQFLRHDSMYMMDDEVITVPGFDTRFGGVQEFSQRYSDEIEFTDRDMRRQDGKNRQNSIDNFTATEMKLMRGTILNQLKQSLQQGYKSLRDKGVAKECARVILPEGMTMSTLYVNGTLRSWLHWLDVRDDPGVTQHEHIVLARKVGKVLEPVFPKVFSARGKI